MTKGHYFRRLAPDHVVDSLFGLHADFSWCKLKVVYHFSPIIGMVLYLSRGNIDTNATLSISTH